MARPAAAEITWAASPIVSDCGPVGAYAWPGMPSGFGECRGNGCDVFSIDEGFSACADGHDDLVVRGLQERLAGRSSKLQATGREHGHGTCAARILD
jgi:hypothetical protein